MTPPRGSSMTTWHYRCEPELLVLERGRHPVCRNLRYSFAVGAVNENQSSAYLSIPKMLSGANAFEISEIQEERNASRCYQSDPEYNNVTLHRKLATVKGKGNSK